MAESVGERLFSIRLACGDGVRKPEPMREFAERVKRRTGRHYDPMAISLLERMKQTWRLEDVRVFAAVDPKNRGEVWLSALSETASWPEHVHVPADVPELTVLEGDGDHEPELAPTRSGAPRRGPRKKAVHPLDDVKGAAKPKRGRNR